MRRALFWAFIAVAVQLVAGFRFAADSTPSGGAALVRFDALRHLNIAVNGYGLSNPRRFDATSSNVYCFPAFPLAARFMAFLTRLGPEYAVLVTSWVFAVLFWWMFFYLLTTSGAPGSLVAAAGVFALSFPTGWYAVVGYSESMFCFFTLLALHLGARGRWKVTSLVLFVASLTRPFGFLVGVALAVSAAVVRLARYRDPVARRRLPPMRGIAAFLLAGAAGPALFMLYCDLMFGRWNLYWTTQVSMSVERPALANLFSDFVWKVQWPPPGGAWRDFDAVSYGGFLTPFYVWALVAAIVIMLIRVRRPDEGDVVFQGALPLVAFASVAISLSIFGGSMRMWGLVRYLLVPHALLTLWLVRAVGPFLSRRVAWAMAILLIGVSFLLWGPWLVLFRRYAAGLFVG